MLCSLRPFKGERFPLSGQDPLLIDPTTDDPWLDIDFDPGKGNLTARFLVALNTVSEKGKATVDLLKLDRREEASNGYLKYWARMKASAERSCTGRLPENGLIEDLIQMDDHGLLGWCTRGAGVNEPPFDEVWAKAPEVLEKLGKSS